MFGQKGEPKNSWNSAMFSEMVNFFFFFGMMRFLRFCAVIWSVRRMAHILQGICNINLGLWNHVVGVGMNATGINYEIGATIWKEVEGLIVVSLSVQQSNKKHSMKNWENHYGNQNWLLTPNSCAKMVTNNKSNLNEFLKKKAYIHHVLFEVITLRP